MPTATTSRPATPSSTGWAPPGVHSVAGNDCSLSAAETADQYAATLPDEPFDVVLLGMGPDGHVASLFPHHPQLREADRDCVELFDSPKPPPVRISMTFPALNHTESVWFLVSGEEKADAVARALATKARSTRHRPEVHVRKPWLLKRGLALPSDAVVRSALAVGPRGSRR